LTDRFGVNSERGKLGPLAQASLELGETREACQPELRDPTARQSLTAVRSGLQRLLECA
jgi:hypothetical protein